VGLLSETGALSAWNPADAGQDVGAK